LPVFIPTLVGFALLVAAAARADLTGSPSLWRHPVLIRLGELSFAFYMIHVLILRTGEKLFASHPHLPLLPALGATLAAFACSLTLAWILYECVEGPARRLLLRPRRVAAAPARA
jgi:peptidoglycan/LPS O-acetylase OafA/YrhL